MGRPGRSEASGLRFDHRLEGIAAQCPLLLQVEANFGELFRWYSLGEDAALGFPAFGLATGEALPDRVFAEVGSRALAPYAAVLWSSRRDELVDSGQGEPAIRESQAGHAWLARSERSHIRGKL